jgi:hypothetical protein
MIRRRLLLYPVLAACTAFTPPAPTTGDGNFLAFTVTASSQRFDKTIVYQDLAYTPFVPVAEEVTVDKYGRPFNEPTRVKVRQNEGSFVYPYQTIATPGDGAYVPGFVTTSVRHDRTIIFDDLAYAPYTEVVAEVVTSDKWFAPFSQPRFVKRITAEEGSFFLVGDDASKYAWRGPLSEPVRRIPQAREGDYTQAPTQPQANDGIGWHRPFSEPTRRKVFLEGDVAFSSTQPEANDGIGWHRPFSEPTRRKNFLEGDTAYSPTLVEDAGISVKWFQPFGVPRAAKRVPEFPAHFYSPYFVPALSGIGTEFNWWPNLSERLRQRRPVAQQQALIQGPQSPITVTLEYAWHRPLSEPTRRTVSRQTAGAAFNPFPQITIAWHQGFSLPVRRKLITAEEGSTFFLRAPAQTSLASATFTGPVFSRYLISQTLAFVPSPAQSGVGVGTDQPWPPFAEPVRFKLGLKAWQQQYLIYYPLLLSSDLDPACRVIDVFPGRVVVTGGPDDVVAFGKTDVTPTPGDDLTPEPGKRIKVKC